MSITSISADTQKLLKKRITGFRLSLGVLALLTVLSTVGIANSFLDEYLDFSVAEKLRNKSFLTRLDMMPSSTNKIPSFWRPASTGNQRKEGPLFTPSCGVLHETVAMN
ncbi:microsomal glutathione S-transferase 2 isoform X1 [Pseudorca crassidens]|uniref:microsomal glutathione S-transferase 2 isoform X1 n=1 Tax=Pseudorca crassidens TaxID=82174 RepID=UPI00352F7B07